MSTSGPHARGPAAGRQGHGRGDVLQERPGPAPDQGRLQRGAERLQSRGRQPHGGPQPGTHHRKRHNGGRKRAGVSTSSSSRDFSPGSASTDFKFQGVCVFLSTWSCPVLSGLVCSAFADCPTYEHIYSLFRQKGSGHQATRIMAPVLHSVGVAADRVRARALVIPVHRALHHDLLPGGL